MNNTAVFLSSTTANIPSVSPTVNSVSASSSSASDSPVSPTTKMATSTSSAPSLSSQDIILQPNSADVLCGRGRAIRFHPGNLLYNKLLKDYYDEYTQAKKGTKLDIVKRIVHSIQNQEDGGRGRFLEKLTGGGSYYMEVDEERAMNKIAQGFRDLRVSKEGTKQKKRKQPLTTAALSIGKASLPTKRSPTSLVSAAARRGLPGSLTASDGQPRRLSFTERVKLLQQQQKRAAEKDSDEDDDDTDASSSEEDNENREEGSDEENRSNGEDEEDDEESVASASKPNDDDADGGDVSETETEDSFPTYRGRQRRREKDDDGDDYDD
mmetsp:Transcript_21195/g.37308  ORF Transcript_21195/g.37308 Transcript_21195/m.37308 type:complete len:324 (+) Transcript_21195:211-1182(+)